MLSYINIVIAFTSLIVCSSLNANAQKIDLSDYENKAQAYAILSAQFSNDAYRYSKLNFYLGSISTIKRNCDTAVVCIEIALDYADSACTLVKGDIDNAAAVLVMKKSIQYQNNAINNFSQIRKATNIEEIHFLSETSMYNSSNALAEAYKASLYFVHAEDSLDSEESTRDVTRLESDEQSFNTVKEIFANRLIGIEKERALLEEELKTARGDAKVDIEKKLDVLIQDEKELLTKMSDSDDKLVDIKTELSEEMVGIVDKDVFTTEKEGFYDEKVPVPEASKVQKGLVYKVQIGFFKKRLPDDHFDGIFPVASEKIDDTHHRYLAGNFAKYEEAKEARSTIFNKGYHDSFVVAYVDGEKIPVYKALKIENAK